MDFLEIYRQMLTIRKFEEKGYELFTKGLILGSLHTSIGQEAIAVGVSQALESRDTIVSNHRGHGHTIAKGADINKMMSELCGRTTGYCQGMGGSMHIAAFDKGVAGCNGIVGAGLPIATGIALAHKIKKTDGVVVAYFGEGATNEGTFHESMNLAAIWRLPILFVCENNGYAVSMPFQRAFAIKNISQRADSYGMPGETIDGMDVLTVNKRAAHYIERAREYEGPALLECMTYRFMGHSRGDPKYGPYRSKEEWEDWQKKDPLKVFLEQVDIPNNEIEKVTLEVQQNIDKAEEFALTSPKPAPSRSFQVYA